SPLVALAGQTVSDATFAPPRDEPEPHSWDYGTFRGQRDAPARRPITRVVRCQSCKCMGAVWLRVRLDPITWHVEARRLCTPCGHGLGFVRPSLDGSDRWAKAKT